MKGIAVALLATALSLPLGPALAQPGHAGHRLAHRAHRVIHAARPPQDDWGTTVYGASLPSVNGTCVDPYDPDPIGGPDHVGDGGPGGYGPSCRAQAGVIPGTTVP